MLIRRIARPMLSAVFIGRGIDTLRSTKPAADAARPALEGLSRLPGPVGEKVPADAELVAKVTGAVQIAGGALLALGRAPRLASAVLAASLVPGGLAGHPFWTETDPQRKADERRAFLTEVSLLGGLIIAAVDTEGRPSLAWRSRRAAAKVGAALPGGDAPVTEHPLVEKLEHGLQAGATATKVHGAALATATKVHGAALATATKEHGAALATATKEHGAALAAVVREKAPELAAVVRERGAELAEVAREKAPELAAVARERGAELAEVAREKAPELSATARDRSGHLADVARRELRRRH